MPDIDEDTLDQDPASTDVDSPDPSEAPEAVDESDINDDGADDSATPDDDTATGDDADASLTTDDTETPEDTPEPVDWEAKYQELEKRYKGIRPAHDELAHKLKQYEKYGDIPLDEAVETYRRQQSQVKPWDPSSPKHTQFQQTLQKWDIYKQQLARSDDPQSVAAHWEGMFAPDEIDSIRQWENHEREFQRKLASNPREALREIVRQESAQVYQTQSSFQADLQTATSILKDPKNSDVVNQHWETIQQQAAQLPPNAPPRALQDIIDRVRDQEELKQLRAERVKAAQATAQAQAQQQAAKGRATVGRDPKATQKFDSDTIYRKAKKKAAEMGIETKGKAFRDLLVEVEREFTS